MSQATTATEPHLYSATGIPSHKLGMWLFLASEIMFFTGLIAAYIVLRLGHPAWPGSEGHLSVPMGTLNTFVLICSSMTIVMALAALQDGHPTRLRWWLLATIGLGSLFLAIKAVEYTTKFSHHIVPSSGIFWSCYYTLTGFHALHVLGGIVFNAWVLSWTFRPAIWARKSHMLELAGLYWHFVDIVWIFLFPLLYLL